MSTIMTQFPRGRPDPSFPPLAGGDPEVRPRVPRGEGFSPLIVLDLLKGRMGPYVQGADRAFEAHVEHLDTALFSYRRMLAILKLPSERLTPVLERGNFQNSEWQKVAELYGKYRTEIRSESFAQFAEAKIYPSIIAMNAIFYYAQNERKRVEGEYERLRAFLGVPTLWNRLSYSEKSVVCDALVFDLCWRKYGCQAGFWRPDQPIENLHREFEEHGPLCVMGHFGSYSYRDQAQILPEKLGNYPLRGWPNSLRVPNIALHAILLVGRVDDLCAYIDPCDSDDPEEEPPLRAIRYETLCADIRQISIPIRNRLEIPGIPFVLYYKKQEID